MIGVRTMNCRVYSKYDKGLVNTIHRKVINIQFAILDLEKLVMTL